MVTASRVLASFSTLPEQVAYTVLETMYDVDLCNLAAVNKRYNALLRNDSFWKTLCRRRFGGGFGMPEKEKEKEREKEKAFAGPWRRFYIFQRTLSMMGKNDYKTIIFAAVRTGFEDIFTFSIESIRAANHQVDFNEVLFVAATEGKTKIVKICFEKREMLLDYGASINATSASGQTPIFLAKQRDLVYFLLQLFDAGGMAPIHLHAENGCIEPLKCMIEADTVNMKSSSGSTPLIYAAAKGHLQIVKFLLNVGASINQQNLEGRTPLHAAAYAGALETVCFLISKNAKLDILDKFANSALDVAVAANHFQVAFELLKKSGKIINIQEFANCRETKVGGGAFAEVYGVNWRDRMVALKKVRYTKLIEAGKAPEWVLSKFILEVALMSKLNCNTYFVPLYGAVIQPPYLYLVLEYMSGGSLYQVLNSDVDTFLGSMPSINSIALNIANGVAYLHSLKPQIIHRDLTSQNVLISNEGVAKIADFGISRFKEEIGDKTMTAIGNPRWRAPEVTKAQRYSEKVDVFGPQLVLCLSLGGHSLTRVAQAFGFILYELFARGPPFTHMLDPNQVAYFVAIGQRPSIPPTCPAEWASLMTSCWSDNPAQRPSFSNILDLLPSLPLAYIPLHSRSGGGGDAFEIVPYY